MTGEEFEDIVKELGSGLHAIANALHKLGLNNANTHMGALENLAKAIIDSANTIAGSIESLTTVLAE